MPSIPIPNLPRRGLLKGNRRGSRAKMQMRCVWFAIEKEPPILGLLFHSRESLAEIGHSEPDLALFGHEKVKSRPGYDH